MSIPLGINDIFFPNSIWVSPPINIWAIFSNSFLLVKNTLLWFFFNFSPFESIAKLKMRIYNIILFLLKTILNRGNIVCTSFSTLFYLQYLSRYRIIMYNFLVTPPSPNFGGIEKVSCKLVLQFSQKHVFYPLKV